MAKSRMKFFTPMLVQRMHEGRVRSFGEWQAAAAAYDAHVAAILPALPRSAAAFTKLHFHDCRIKRIDLLSPNTVVLQLDGFKNDRASRRGIGGHHWLTFKEVTQSNLTFGHLAAWWLYEEIDQADDRVELRVRLDEGKPNELQIQFRSVAIRTERSRP